jgi:hypothetical protein
MRSLDAGKTVRSRLAKVVSGQIESAAEADLEDLTIARFVTGGGHP